MTLTRWFLKIRLDGMRRSPLRSVSLLFSIAGLSLAIGPSLLKGLQEIGQAGDSAQAYARTAGLFTFSFVVWVLAGGIFQFHLGWQIDLPRAIRLPVAPWKIYQSRLLYGLFGPWLLALFPAWLWLAWRQAGSGISFLLLLPAIGLFAMLCNQLAGIVSLLRNRLTTGIPWMLALFCGFGLVNALLFAALRSQIVGDNSTLASLGRAARGLPRMPASLPLPSGVMARLYLAASVPAPGRMLVWETLLAAFVFAAGWIEMALLRRVYWRGEPFGAGRSKDRGAWLAPALNAFRGRPGAALFLKELHALLENKSLRVLLFFFFSYMPIFVIFAPPPSYFMAQSLCTMPVLVFSHLKANLLGSEHLSRKIFFTSPAGLFASLRMKNGALNLLVGLLLGTTLLIGAATGRLAFTGFENMMIAIYCAALFCVWNMLGYFCSVFHPDPTDTRGVLQGSGLNAGGFLMILGVPLVLVVFALLQWGCARANHPRLALPGGAAILLLLAGVHYRIYLPWLRARLASRRETLYQQLAEPVL